MENIRNFVIIAHIDHGKSTLADRFLELTGTVEKRKMREQYLDAHPLERERGITIKMTPVRMTYALTNADLTQTSADSSLLYNDITYKIRGAVFEVRKALGSGHKESVYQRALEVEFERLGLAFEKEKNIEVIYEGRKVGMYRPDFIIENRILLELKALPFIGKQEEYQVWNYLRGTYYRLALLVNFGPGGADIKRIVYDSARMSSPRLSAYSPPESAYVLNLIDTPGHVDFSYEVSRALAAVEGAILLVDATQGVQAQTLANLNLAQKEGLVIIPVINKIDLPSADVEKTEEELTEILQILPNPPLSRGGEGGFQVLKISGKTGEGVERLLLEVIEKVPSPAVKFKRLNVETLKDVPLRALVFDSIYDSYQGVVAYVRIFEGTIKNGEKIKFLATGAEVETLEVGVFSPERRPQDFLGAGEIGYIATGIKELEKVRVGDTITGVGSLYTGIRPLSGYKEPEPMMFASIFPENQDDYEALRESLKKLKLNDASLVFQPEESGALGRGYRTGFLGMLHMEIISERLRREYGLKLLFTNPSVAFRIKNLRGREEIIFSASKMPPQHEISSLEEPWARVEIITPPRFLGALTSLIHEREGKILETSTLSGERLLLIFEAPLREIIIDFYDALKSVSEGFASMSYQLSGFRKQDLVRLDILVAGEKIPSFSEIVPREKAYSLARARVEKLKEFLPRELFAVAIQAEVEGRIIARETISALKKDVTGYLYGGDRTRKMKLWKKQQRGKKKLKAMGRVEIPPEVFLKMLKK